MLLTVSPHCPPTSAQAGSFLPGWEIALAWNFSAGVGWGGECFWRQVQNLQLPAFLRQIQRRRDKDCTVSGGSGGGGRGGEEEMAVPDKPSQLGSHPRGPLLWPPSLLSPVPLVRTMLRYITGTLNPGTPGWGELLISPLTLLVRRRERPTPGQALLHTQGSPPRADLISKLTGGPKCSLGPDVSPLGSVLDSQQHRHLG